MKKEINGNENFENRQCRDFTGERGDCKLQAFGRRVNKFSQSNKYYA